MATREDLLLRKKNLLERKKQVLGEKSLVQRIDIAAEETPGRIEERGTIQQNIAESFGRALPGGGKPGVGRQALDIAQAAFEIPSIPTRAIESGISGATLPLQQIQARELTPIEAAKESVSGLAKGITLQEQPKFEDVLRGAGLSETPSKILGFGASIAIPIGILSKINKTFGTLSKSSDKGILKAGDDVVKSIDEAIPALGQKVDDAFSPVQAFLADKVKFADDFAGLPDIVRKKAVEVFGSLDDITKNLTLGKLREFKRWLGKLRQTSFGKVEKGVADTLDDIAINKAYAGIKSNIDDTIRNTVKGEQGNTLAGIVSKAEEGFTELNRAAQFLKKTIVDPTLKKATKSGALATKIQKQGDVTARVAINIVKRASREANKSMNNAIDALNKFSRHKAFATIGRQVGRGAIVGGVAGKVLGSRGEDSEDVLIPTRAK